MLTSLRKMTEGVVMKVILGLLVIAFGAWGVSGAFTGGTTVTLASVGDTKIDVETFRDRFTREMQRAGNQFGRALTPADARAVGLDRNVLNQLLADATFEEAAKRLKLGVPQANIADTIMNDENFRGPAGQFDPNRFDQLLRSNGFSEATYVETQRRFMLRRQILDGLVSGVGSPDVLTEAVFRHQNERRSASYVVLPGSDGADIATPDEAVLKAFFEERKGTFQAPELRTVTVVAATSAALAAKETISDEDVRARFEQDKARLGTPERRTVERITFPSLAEAQAASAKIKSGTTFEEIATARNVAAADLSLGSVSRGEILDKVIGDAAFALPQGQISEPLEGQFTTAILRVTAIQPEVMPDFDTVKESLRTDMAVQRAQDKLLTLHDQIEDDRASGMTLAEIATKYSLETQTIENLDRQGRANKAPANLPGGDAVLSEVFQSDVGVENNAVQIDGGGYVWFDVTKVDPARQRTYDEAKDDVLARWKSEEARKRLDAKADEALKALKDGSLKLPDLATREGVEVRAAERLDRRGGDLGQGAAAQIFSTPRGGFGSAPATNDGQVIFQVTAIETPPLNTADPGATQLKDRIAETIENDLAGQYVQQLQKDLGTTINNQALATAIGVQAEQ
jgi:peptidyl-prolyl cis-trans isomerase D